MAIVPLKHNSYFDGQVQSIGFERHGRRATAGVIAPGSFHFGTEGAERMTIISGTLFAKIGGNAGGKTDSGDWLAYPAGTSFEVAARSGFDVRANEAVAYLCEFI